MAMRRDEQLEEEAKEGGNLLVCDKCALTFSSKMSLAMHLRTHTVSVNMLKCHLCDYTSHSDIFLSSHIKKHEDSYRYVKY